MTRNGDNIRVTPEMRKAIQEAGRINLSKLAEQVKTANDATDEVRRRVIAETGQVLLGAMAGWSKQQGAAQADMARMAQKLVENADFEGLMAGFAVHQLDLFKHLTFDLAAMERSVYPPNLREIDSGDFDAIDQILFAEGIALYGAPRSSIVQELIDAADGQERRRVLEERWRQIAEDCRGVVERCASDEMQAAAAFAGAAITALEEGHDEAAQALIGTLTDTLVGQRFGEHRYKFTSPDTAMTDAAYDKVTLREYIAFAPMWSAYQRYRPEKNDPVPVIFNRHATVHGVGREQYSRCNTVQGLLFVCGVIRRIDEEPDFLEGNPDWVESADRA